ncbi:proteasome subunit beta type-6 [Anopheles maculipalpis]|uniref:proteasome subunit beta type-6 n=1 Tax=Anopheles maculipalpis TaxID=1496333 RepID=UPI0021598F19|nr:proteasome subunit beta type-6 [Anopheles maculipalpis]XP_050078460.1 proteasome subunit beta type-6 [Anopheles maculipalpis]
MDMDYSNDWRNAHHSTGTTIMAVEFEGGVVIGADSRTSTGTYVANRVTDKLTKLTDKIYCCRSGSAADTQAIADIVAYSLNYHENQTGEAPLVEDAANEFRQYCYNYRDTLVAGIIVAGWDAKQGGQVYSVPVGGMQIRQSVTIGGSGSSYIYGFVKENYREGMARDACVEFVKKSIFHAMYHDGSSGGVCRIGVITKDGVEREVFFAPRDYENVPSRSGAPPSVSVQA